MSSAQGGGIDEIRKLIEERVEKRASTQDIDALDPASVQRIEDWKTDRALKGKYAVYFLWALAGQLLVMNAVVVGVGFSWLTFSEYVLHLYMGGTLLEIFGVVLVITRSHFFFVDWPMVMHTIT